jgi:hypothetical protein
MAQYRAMRIFLPEISTSHISAAVAARMQQKSGNQT